MADNNVLFEGILLKPSMVTPGAEHAKRPTPEEVRAGLIAGASAADVCRHCPGASGGRLPQFCFQLVFPSPLLPRRWRPTRCACCAAACPPRSPASCSCLAASPSWSPP
jgi:hypothetical protein